MSGSVEAAVAALALTAAALLVVAGVAKVRSPAVAARGLAASGLYEWPAAAVTIGVLEACAGGWLLATASRPALGAVAGFYAVFAAVTLRALARKDAGQPCGCLGDAEATLSPTHLAFNVVVAAAAAAACAAGSPVPAVVPPGSATAALTLAGAGVTSYLAYLLLTAFEPAIRSYKAPTSKPKRTAGGVA
jgi:hypothetical protein